MQALLLALLLSWQPASLAADSCALVPALQTELELAYYNRHRIPDYFPGYCSSNIYKLVDHLVKGGIGLGQAEVIYLFRRDEKMHLDSIWPGNSRSWNGQPWVFHVVLNYEGMILDLDYAEPRLERAEVYFEKMFANGGGSNEGMLLKKISAGDFHRLYILHYAEYPKTFLLPKTDEAYPPLLLSAYLSRMPRSPCLKEAP